jgi:hypothetical protein
MPFVSAFGVRVGGGNLAPARRPDRSTPRPTDQGVPEITNDSSHQEFQMTTATITLNQAISRNEALIHRRPKVGQRRIWIRPQPQQDDAHAATRFEVSHVRVRPVRKIPTIVA